MTQDSKFLWGQTISPVRSLIRAFLEMRQVLSLNGLPSTLQMLRHNTWNQEDLNAPRHLVWHDSTGSPLWRCSPYYLTPHRKTIFSAAFYQFLPKNRIQWNAWTQGWPARGQVALTHKNGLLHWSLLVGQETWRCGRKAWIRLSESTKIYTLVKDKIAWCPAGANSSTLLNYHKAKKRYVSPLEGVQQGKRATLPESMIVKCTESVRKIVLL